jgi:hypothetical protein
MPYTSSYMHELSEKDLHDRAIKGWKTRRMHKPTKKQVAGGLAGTYVGVKLNSGRRLLRHQYEWHRPSGEIVPIRGFSKKHIDNITPALQEIDHHVDPEKVNLHNFSAIERRNIGLVQELSRAQAVYMPGEAQLPSLFKEKGVSEELQEPLMRFAKILHGTKMSKKGKVMIPSRTVRSQSDLGGVLQHELGHAFDYAVLHSEGAHLISKDMPEPTNAYSSSNNTYQESQQVEDFAESFRGRLGDLAGARRPITQNAAQEAIAPGFFDPNITPARRKFMDEKIFRTGRRRPLGAYVPGMDDGRRITITSPDQFERGLHVHYEMPIVEKAGLHQHTNHLLIGAGMLAGAAAITYHQRHAEDHGADH